MISSKFILPWIFILSFGGCAVNSDTQRSGGDEARAKFYWTYAALAADVYDERKVDSWATLAVSSPWLREKAQKVGGEANVNYDKIVQRQSSEEGKKSILFEDFLKESNQNTDTLPLSNGEPKSFADCEQDPTKVPVPLDAATRADRWRRVPELRRDTSAKGWAFFVPDLSIDIWRRDRSANAVEYAIVYRGTVGGGGWLSNFRSLTAHTPVVWDQYRQARRATRELVNQIGRLHQVSDSVLAYHTEVFITAVGHSLGAGIATYIYYVTPEITRVVGFDPSPVDASSTLSLDDRGWVMNQDGPRKKREILYKFIENDEPRRVSYTESSEKSDRRIDDDKQFPGSSIYLLFEKGDVLSRFFPCKSGPVWGQNGDPKMVCEHVNLLTGSWVQQHDMARLSCALYLAAQGLRKR